MDGKKQCATCREWKALEAFQRCRANKDGRYAYCKTCVRAKNQRQVIDPATGELCTYGALKKRKLVVDPATGVLVKSAILSARRKRDTVEKRENENRKSRERYANNELHRDASRQSTRDWYRRHGAWFRFISAQTKQHNEKTHPTHKAYCTALVLATPKWLTESHWDQMNRLYEQIYQTDNSIDHITPIIGRDDYGNHIVCGLNVPWNLQIMCRKANQRKGQKLEHRT